MQHSIGWRVCIFFSHVVQAVHLVGDITNIFTGSLRTNDAGNICSQVSPLQHNYEEELQRESLRHPFLCCNALEFSGSSVFVPIEIRFPFL